MSWCTVYYSGDRRPYNKLALACSSSCDSSYVVAIGANAKTYPFFQQLNPCLTWEELEQVVYCLFS